MRLEGAGRRDWVAVAKLLESSASCAETDDLIDELTEDALEHYPGTECASALRWALQRAQSVLTRRSAALALAIVADESDSFAVDDLTNEFRVSSEDNFLSISLLESLALLAMRSPLARTELNAIILRLNFGTTNAQNNRHFLIGVAKIIGRLLNRQRDDALYRQLDVLTQADDLAVQAEARFQIALTTLVDVLLAHDEQTLVDQLRNARAAFSRAEASEELRPDATMFVGFLSVLIDFHSNPAGNDVQFHIDRCMGAARRLIHVAGYQSETATLRAGHIRRALDALQRVTNTVREAELWVSIYEVLVELATLYAVIRTPEPSSDGLYCAAWSEFGRVIIAPALGPLLSREVTRARMQQILDKYSGHSGNTSIANGLRELAQAALRSSAAVIPTIDQTKLAQLAIQTGKSAPELTEEFLRAVETGTIDRWMDQEGFALTPLPIDRPGLFGGDPNVDETVRKLLRQLRSKLGRYDVTKWSRVVTALEVIISHVNFIRDSIPQYALCAADGGMGQGASEKDLQRDIFQVLRQKFGRPSIHEMAGIGGGRADTGLLFPECQIPIEMKHEFQSVDERHIRSNYLPQTDIYAGAADRVGILLILDLREGNSAGHTTCKPKRTSEKVRTIEPTALYRLRESFWLDELPPDTQIKNPEQKAVIVGLVPGNRPRPSSTTVYSRRPSRVRKITP